MRRLVKDSENRRVRDTQDTLLELSKAAEQINVADTVLVALTDEYGNCARDGEERGFIQGSIGYANTPELEVHFNDREFLEDVLEALDEAGYNLCNRFDSGHSFTYYVRNGERTIKVHAWPRASLCEKVLIKTTTETVTHHEYELQCAAGMPNV